MAPAFWVVWKWNIFYYFNIFPGIEINNGHKTVHKTFSLLLWRHSNVVKWRENVTFVKNVNFDLKLHSSKLKLNISASKNQLNIFTTEQVIINAQTVKILSWFFDVLVVYFTIQNVKFITFWQNMHFPPLYDVTMTSQERLKTNLFFYFGHSYLLVWWISPNF